MSIKTGAGVPVVIPNQTIATGAAVPEETKAQTVAQLKTTGLTSLDDVNLDGESAEDAQNIKKLRAGLKAVQDSGTSDIEMSAEQKQYIKGLSQSAMGKLADVSDGMMTMLNIRGPGPNINQQALKPGGSDVLDSRWKEFFQTAELKGGLVDVNSLVQWVLRESYLETTKDLYMYAEKVKFFNETKKRIRDELSKARDSLVNMAGKDANDALDPPFMPVEIDATFAGDSEARTNETPEAIAAQKALDEAQGALEDGQSGKGVHIPTGDEKKGLKPKPHGNTFITEDGYRVDHSGDTVLIYGPPDANGKNQLLTKIWGDPHVNEGGGDDDWHFGNDSTFILPDGSKLCLNTEETHPGSGIFVTKGIELLSGEMRAHSGLTHEGKKEKAAVTDDRARWDGAHKDFQGVDGGVFALMDDGEWAKLGTDGQFRDVKEESWGDFLQDKDVDTQGNPVAVTSAQQLAAQDHLGALVAGFDDALGEAEKFGVIKTKGELENYIEDKEEQLNSVGDDAQLANVDLQNMLQKQQQTMQMMSNIAKMLHDTAMAIIRKIGG